MIELRAPMPWFGTKRSIAPEIWQRLGNPSNYIEPFMGSLAILLARPDEPNLEMVNDMDALLCNAYRAIQHDPEETARMTCWPPSELEIIARHRWIMETGLKRIQKLKEDPHYYDIEVAGFWLYGISAYVGGGWCDGKGYKNQEAKIPAASQSGVFRRDLDGDPKKLGAYFEALAWRLRNVKIACGSWERVITPAFLNQGGGPTAVVLDPPYADGEHTIQYSGGGNVARAVRKWCVENGENPNLRIALCGYESWDYPMPDNWESMAWKASGGYGNQGDGKGRENAGRERVWFSPHCLKPGLMGILGNRDHAEILPEEPQGGREDWPVVRTGPPVCGQEPEAGQPSAPVPPARRGGLFDLIGD